VVNILTRAMILALGLTILPAASGQVEVLALPATVSEQVDVPVPDAAEVAAQGQTTGGAATVVTDVITAPMPFSMVGFELPDGVDELRVRTSADGESWSDWVATERFDAEDGPDPDSGEQDASHRHAEPVWVEEATHLQVELPADQADQAEALRAELIDSAGLSGGEVERRVVTSEPVSSADASNRPQIITRSQWGADESLARPTSRTNNVHMGVVHHTATSNSYSDARAVMRAMYRYHTQNLGWADLGYNIVVDQQGNVYEGRAGGLENGVIGAHARGYNTGSFGVSVIGNFDQIRPPRAAVDAVTEVIAWQSRVYDIDPEAWTNGMNGSWHRTLLGHRDVGQTSCPGTHFHPMLDDIRQDAANRMSLDRAPDDPDTGDSGSGDYTPPNTSITSGPSGTVTDSDVTIAFSATGDVSYYECQMGDDPWYACASPRTFSNLADGEHTFRVRAVMPSDPPLPVDERIREEEPAEVTWRVKATPPTTTIDSGPSGTVDRDEVRFEFSASESDASFECRLNGDAWAPCSSPMDINSLNNGDQTFQVRAIDGYGNVEPEPATRSWQVQGLSNFKDIADSVHLEDIRAVAEAGIAGGYPDGTFRPAADVTRGQMATFLARGLELADSGAVGFADTEGSPHEQGINAIAAAGISEGYGDGTFRPNERVSREQLATFLARALELEGGGEITFSDTATSVHAESIEAVAAAEITAGYPDGTFRPREQVSREQMAAFLARGLGL
jgi:hypothetical protein